MNWIERYFRRRAVRRMLQPEDDLPSALAAVQIGTVVAINGYNFRVMHRRCEPGGRAPGLVLAPIGPTRHRLKMTRTTLKKLLRRSA